MSPRPLLTTLLCVASCLTALSGAAQAAPPPVGDATKVWQQTFGDDFTTSVVDPLKWTSCYFWVGNGGCTNAANGELEWYQPGNVSSSHGTLKLRATKQTVVASGRSYDYTSGMVTTGRSTTLLDAKPRYDFTYGYAEIRMKLPKGKGLWPAFWMLPSSHGWPPELDIFENIGSKPTQISMNDHYLDATGATRSYGRWYDGPDFTTGWHTVGLDWQPDRLVWYVDGVVRHWTTDPQTIPQQPMYLLANLAVGGTWPGAPDATTTFPATFEIDYMRVWQRVAAAATSTTATATTATRTTKKR